MMGSVHLLFRLARMPCQRLCMSKSNSSFKHHLACSCLTKKPPSPLPHELPNWTRISLLGTTRAVHQIIVVYRKKALIDIIFFFLRFYLFIHERHTQREAETQVEGEAGSTQGARRGIRSRDPRTSPWAEGGTKPLSHPGIPDIIFLN